MLRCGVRRPRERNDTALLGALNGARLGRILLECVMRARAVVVADRSGLQPTANRIAERRRDELENRERQRACESVAGGLRPGYRRCNHPEPPVSEIEHEACRAADKAELTPGSSSTIKTAKPRPFFILPSYIT